MSLVLKLPAKLETELAAQAARLQLPLEEYATRLLARAGATTSQPTSGADLVVYWKQAGLLGTRPDIADAPKHARALRRKAEKRTR